MLVDQLLKTAFSSLVRRGSLEVVTAKGKVFKVGDGTAPQVAVRFTDAAAERALVLDPELRLGELYMDGRFLVEHGTIFDFFQLVLQDSHGELDSAPLQRIRQMLGLVRRVQRANDAVRSKTNVAHHYDLNGRLYISHISVLKRDLIKRKIRKLAKSGEWS